MARLLERYKSEIHPALKDELSIKNALAVPRLDKVVVSMGLGKSLLDKKRLEAAVKDLSAITGQRPVVCKARKSVSNFKLRKGYDVGAKVTLRGRRMFEFVDRLINVAVPRMRDFRGLKPSGFDGRGNYSLGIGEQTIFPEINIDKMEYPQGMNITFVTSAGNDDAGKKLLGMLGVPFRRTDAPEERI